MDDTWDDSIFQFSKRITKNRRLRDSNINVPLRCFRLEISVKTGMICLKGALEVRSGKTKAGELRYQSLIYFVTFITLLNEWKTKHVMWFAIVLIRDETYLVCISMQNKILRYKITNFSLYKVQQRYRTRQF